MSILTAIDAAATRLRGERDRAPGRGLDRPIEIRDLSLQASVGTLTLYTCHVPPGASVLEDTPVSLVPADGGEPTEGVILGQQGTRLLLQVVEPIGAHHPTATLVPDATAFLDGAAKRLGEVLARPHLYTLGPADRLVGLLDAEPDHMAQVSKAVSASVLTTYWGDQASERRARLSTLLLDLVRSNKRALVISPDHATADEMIGSVARGLKAAGLPYRSHVTRYEVALTTEASGLPLGELGFEAQMHQFFAKSRSDKATLRRKYERFRELTPILVYKSQKQQELDEVKLLEWRLMTQLTECRAKIAEIDQTVATYEALPIWKRLTMQTMGKNVASLGEYRALYDQQAEQLCRELDVAKRRIDELSPEAAIPRDMRPEYDELKEEVVRLGGTKKIRELLAAEEGTNRQAFIQNRRVVVTTAGRVMSDPLFAKVRFDVLVVEEAPWISAPFVLGAAALVRERIVLSGDLKDFTATKAWHLHQEGQLWRALHRPVLSVG